MIVTRDEFKQWIKEQFEDHDMTADSSPVWIPEDQPGLKCQHFVFGPTDRSSREEYWLWCTNTLKGYVRCFWANSDTGDEWWGFTEPEDVPVWLLKWAK